MPTSSLVLYMCQGRQTRMGALPHPKQLISVAGAPLLKRTVRQIHGARQVVVADKRDPHWAHFHAKYGIPMHTLLPDAGACILDGLWHTRELWRQYDRTIIVLGDVVFSEAMARTIMDGSLHANMPTFFTSSVLGTASGEVFALCFGRADHLYLTNALDTVPCRQTPTEPGQAGHLRNLLWWWRDCGYLAHQTRAEDGDYTRDFDTADDLLAVPALEERIRQDAPG